ncbi:major facilitator superfamily domain-containing protein [Obelidium mucronatum]|nr:major facilitator superfamily domain-containing protein [Obelidium mucronatum]
MPKDPEQQQLLHFENGPEIPLPPMMLTTLRRLSIPLAEKIPKVPVLQLRKILLVLVCVMPEVMIYHMLHPLYPYMVQALLPGDSAIGYHTGILQSAYFLPSIISAPLMGRLSDIVGRRRVLLVGLVGYGTGTLLLGISLHYWFAVFTMVVTGCFSGNATVAKSVIGELSSDDHTRALGYSAYGIAYALCSIIGAILGGQLADSQIFSGVEMLKNRPYFTACFFGFVLAGVCTGITYFLLDNEKDVPSGPSSYIAVKEKDEADADEAIGRVVVGSPRIRVVMEHSASMPGLSSSSSGSATDRIYAAAAPYLSILNRHTLTPLALYTLYALTNSVLHTAIPLISASEKGYRLPQKQTAQISMYTASAKLCAKIVFMGVHSCIGSLGVYRVGTLLLIPALVLVSGLVYGFAGLIPGLILVGVGESWAYLSLVMLITEGAQAHDYGKGVGALGLVHGVSGCLAAIVRTLGPAMAGILWETSGAGVLFGVIGLIVCLQVVSSVLFMRTRSFRKAAVL